MRDKVEFYSVVMFLSWVLTGLEVFFDFWGDGLAF